VRGAGGHGILQNERLPVPVLNGDVAVVHIFRFDGDKVVELWDLGQLLSKDSRNERGAF
jgi:predicted SnoaL-like aldol condensation-catalyzing enzyme